MRKSVGFLIVLGPFIVLAVLYSLTTSPIDSGRPLDIPATGPLTIALAGDVLFTGPLGTMERDQAFIAARSAVGSADVALANLDMNLLGAEEALQADARPEPRWPYGSERDAVVLKRLGFDVVTLANDHAGDYGPDAVASTRRILDGIGFLHAGTGADLAAARASASVGRVAVLAVAASSFPDARATPTRGDIAGRAGVSPLRYSADITVDAATFQTLRDSAAALNAGRPAGERELTMFGTPIKKGDRTSVEFLVNEADEREMLEAIKTARASADVVIVSLHAHEPSNASDEPAAFVVRFARAAIDAGATIVVGHGPHRVRGVEAYKSGVILYSLGNFLYRAERLDFRAANLFDAGADLYQAAIGALGGGPEARASVPDDPAWWESVLAVATVEAGKVTGIRLIPLDLGADKSLQTRGIPRMASADQSRRLFGRLTELSGVFGTRLRVEGGAAHLLVGGQAP